MLNKFKSKLKKEKRDLTWIIWSWKPLLQFS